MIYINILILRSWSSPRKYVHNVLDYFMTYNRYESYRFHLPAIIDGLHKSECGYYSTPPTPPPTPKPPSDALERRPSMYARAGPAVALKGW